jgi:hypothetical protein
MKMMNELFSTRERQNLFYEAEMSNFFCTGFLKFQTLFLCTLFAYLLYCNQTDFQSTDLASIVITTALFFIIISLFYLFKQGMYSLNGHLFGDSRKYKRWNANYHYMSCMWGISLYLPVLWLLFDREHLTAAILLFALIYAAFRFTLIYMTVRIFYSKNTGILYLSSYLCAQEIVPLLFLYEGMNYLYNTIEVSTL